MNPSFAPVRAYLLGLQESITSAISAIDGNAFLVDQWEKPAGETLQGNESHKFLKMALCSSEPVAVFLMCAARSFHRLQPSIGLS